jgi:hypothetical protein
MGSDSLARPRSVSSSSIRALLDKKEVSAVDDTPQEPGGTLLERSDPLPRPGDTYKAASRHAAEPQLALHFILKDFSYEGFSYGDFERVRLVPGERPGSGLVLVLRFNGSVVTEVTIEGRHLHPLYHWIARGLISWVWEHPGAADFLDEAVPVVRKISIAEVLR